jgi:hypothetical protein
VITAFVGPQTDRKTLIDFYRLTRPFGPGWKMIREESGLGQEEERSSRGTIPLALLGWVTGCVVIWSSLFTVGNFLYGRMTYAFGLLAVFIVSGVVLLRVVNRLWNDSKSEARLER